MSQALRRRLKPNDGLERLDLDAVDWEQLDTLPDYTVYQTRSWLDLIARAQNAEPIVAVCGLVIKTRFLSPTGLGCGSGVTTPMDAGSPIIVDNPSTAGACRCLAGHD